MRFDRSTNGANCTHCPFREHNKVWSEGRLDSKIVIIGEAPGETEAIQGRPFVGAAGNMLNGALREAEIGRSNAWVTNVICCRPPGNDIKTHEAQEAIERCRPGFQNELSLLQREGKRVYVPTGNTALEALGLERGILQKRGSIYEEDAQERGFPSSTYHPTMLIVPTIHPSYIMRGNWSKRPIFVADLVKAKEVSADGWVPPKENFTTYPTIIELEAFTHYAIFEGQLLAVDIETTGLTAATGEIVCVGLASTAENAICIPFLGNGGKHYWSNGNQTRAEDCLRQLLSSCPTMFQNAVFDVPFLEAKGFPVAHIEHDTLLLHAVIDSDLPHNLGFITSVYGSTPYWKEHFKQRAGGILSLDDETLRTYNLRDCVVLHQVYPPMMKDLADDNLTEVYGRRMELLPVVLKMARQGLLLDKVALTRWEKALEKRQAKQELALRGHTGVIDTFSFESKDDLRLLIHGYIAPKFPAALAAHTKRQDRYDHFVAKGKEESALRVATSAAWGKAQTIVEVLATTQPLWTADDTNTRLTGKTFRPAVDDQAFLSLQLKAQNRRETIGKFRKPTPYHKAEVAAIDHFLEFLSIYRSWAATTKLLSTYTTFTPESDGRVRGSFSLSVARTGRLASRKPNFQNQPLEARKIFVAAPGHIFIERDYSNLELRILAYISGDEKSIADFDLGLNVHDENTHQMWEIDDDDPLWPMARMACKTYIFGRNYGGSLHGIYEKVVLQVPSLGLTFARFKEQDARYRDAHPQEAAWRDKQAATVRQTMVSHDAFGGRRVYRGSRDEAVREGLNQPIQGSAAHIIGQAMIDLDELCQEDDIPARIINQVHDSLLIECREDRVDTMLRYSKQLMEVPIAIAGQRRSFPTDAKTGTCWGSLTTPA